MYHDDDAPMVPNLNQPATRPTRPRPDGGTRRPLDRPPETTGSAADRHREEIEPGAADLR